MFSNVLECEICVLECEICDFYFVFIFVQNIADKINIAASLLCFTACFNVFLKYYDLLFVTSFHCFSTANSGLISIN